MSSDLDPEPDASIEKPSTIFQYHAPTLQSIKNLKQHGIFFSSPTRFNDPYDCRVTATIAETSQEEIDDLWNFFNSSDRLPDDVRIAMSKADIDPMSLRDMLAVSARGMIDMFINDIGVSCFAARKDSALMWSHYAEGYKGFCLEFRTNFEPFSKLRPVIYMDRMPILDLCDVFMREEWETFVQLYCTKSTDWSYEREWRILHKEADTLYTYEAAALKAIYFGPEIDSSTREILCIIIKAQNPEVELWNVGRESNGFRLTFERIEYTTLVDAKRQGLL